jgi:hypothetical protein
MALRRVTGERVSSELDWFFRRDGSMFAVSDVSVPIEMPEGRGAVVAFTDIDNRLRAERALREHEAVLAGQQASLRRVATLVAGGATSAEVFSAIAKGVAAGRLGGQVIARIRSHGPRISSARHSLTARHTRKRRGRLETSGAETAALRLIAAVGRAAQLASGRTVGPRAAATRAAHVVLVACRGVSCRRTYRSFRSRLRQAVSP